MTLGLRARARARSSSMPIVASYKKGKNSANATGYFNHGNRNQPSKKNLQNVAVSVIFSRSHFFIFATTSQNKLFRIPTWQNFLDKVTPIISATTAKSWRENKNLKTKLKFKKLLKWTVDNLIALRLVWTETEANCFVKNKCQIVT